MWFRKGVEVGSCKDGIESSIPIRGEEFDWPNDFDLVKCCN